jgi:hypothetical protein
MTLPLPLSQITRVVQILLLSGLAWYSVATPNHWLLIVSLLWLATIAVLPRANPLLYWPVGLLAVLVTMYIGYWAQWLGTTTGVDEESSSQLFRILIIVFSVCALAHIVRDRTQIEVARAARIITVILMTALPVVLMVLVSQRWGSEPARIISGHLGGGDHGAHNEIVHRMLRESADVTFASPLQMYTYPQAVHFVIANLVALTRDASSLPLLAQEYAMGAWVEWLQFAAFCQMAIVVFMKGAFGTGLRRALFLGPLFFVFAAMDNFVAHLLWSGFTTSLAVTWILMTFIAISDRLRFDKSIRERVVMVAVLLAFAYAGWITYQPYAVIFLGVLVFLVLKQSGDVSFLRGQISKVFALVSRPISQILLTIAVLLIALLGVLGRNSPAVKSLLLDGSTYKPYLYTVLLWAFLAMVGNWLLPATPGNKNESLNSFQFVHFGFVIGMMFTVMVAGDFGFLDQPYYIQKMFWILLFVSLPVALSSAFTWGEGVQSKWPLNQKLGAAFSLGILILLTPLIQGRLPVSATQKHNVDWFANGIVNEFENPENREIAFSVSDRLGSHFGNLALGATSDLVMPVETGISGNPFLACTFMNKNSASLAYTTPNGRAEMIMSGCDPDITYIENGIQQENTSLEYFGVALGEVERPALGQLGFRLLLRGFLPPEKWGTWAGGYRSAIGFDLPKNMENPIIELDLRSHPSFANGREVIVSVNNAEIGTAQMTKAPSQKVKFSLPESVIGKPVELTITCSRTDAEILEDDPVDGPNPCVGVRSLVVRNNR